MTLPADPAERHRAVAAGFTARVQGASDWDAPAPVAGWRARDVVGHLVEWFPDFLTSATGLVLDRGPSPEEDPVAAWQVHADAVQRLLDGPDAATPFKHPMVGEMPLPEAVDRFYTTDVFMHTWDLARATGQDERLDPADLRRPARRDGADRGAAAVLGAVRPPGAGAGRRRRADPPARLHRSRPAAPDRLTAPYRLTTAAVLPAAVGKNGAVSDVEPSEVAAALSRAGLADVDHSRRRRAEYSTDASNYRVVPQRRRLPPPRRRGRRRAGRRPRARRADHRSRRAGRRSPATRSGPAWCSTSRATSTGCSRSTPTPGPRASEPGAVLDSITRRGRAVRPALRPRPVDPRPRHHRRLDRQQRLRLAGPGATAARADNVVGLDVAHRATATRFAARGRGRTARRPPAGPLTAGARPHRRRPTSATIRTEFGRFTRQVSGYSLEHLLPENGADVAEFLVGTEGTLGVVLGRDRAAGRVAGARRRWPCSATPTCRPPPMPCRPCCRTAPSRSRAWTPGWSRCVRARRGAAAVPELPRGGGWLFVETAGATEARGGRRGREGSSPTPGASTRWWSPARTARALWRIREDGAGLGGRTPAGEPAWPGWEDAAVPPDQLGAYLREFDALLARSTASTRWCTGTSATAACTPASTSRSTDDAAAVPRLPRRRGDAGRPARRLDVGRARRRPGPRRAAAADVLPRRASPRSAQVKALFDPDDLLNPGVIVDPARSTPTCACRRPAAAHDLAFAYPHDGGDFPPPCTAASGSASAGPTPPRPAA